MNTLSTIRRAPLLPAVGRFVLDLYGDMRAASEAYVRIIYARPWDEPTNPRAAVPRCGA